MQYRYVCTYVTFYSLDIVLVFSYTIYFIFIAVIFYWKFFGLSDCIWSFCTGLFLSGMLRLCYEGLLRLCYEGLLWLCYEGLLWLGYEGLRIFTFVFNSYNDYYLFSIHLSIILAICQLIIFYFREYLSWGASRVLYRHQHQPEEDGAAQGGEAALCPQVLGRTAWWCQTIKTKVWKCSL